MRAIFCALLVVFGLGLVCSGCGDKDRDHASPTPDDSDVSFDAQTLPQGKVGEAYHYYLQVDGGIAPYEFSVARGALPSGLDLDTDTGLIHGMPTADGTYSLTFQVEAQDNSAASFVTAITVVP